MPLTPGSDEDVSEARPHAEGVHMRVLEQEQAAHRARFVERPLQDMVSRVADVPEPADAHPPEAVPSRSQSCDSMTRASSCRKAEA